MNWRCPLSVLRANRITDGGAAPPPAHPRRRLSSILLEGEYVVEVGSDRVLLNRRLRAGTTASPHAWAFVGALPVGLLISFSTARR